MRSKSDNVQIMINDIADKVIDEFFQSLLFKYQVELETLMKDSDFIFDCVHLMYYKCHKLIFKRGGSYINSSEWIKCTKKQQ